MQWFSAMVRLVGVVEPKGVMYFRDCLHLFQAGDWDDAHARALKLGHSHEEEYKNANGEAVQWKLKEILTLDQIATPELDGAEVYSQLLEVGVGDHTLPARGFDPERSAPAQTI